MTDNPADAGPASTGTDTTGTADTETPTPGAAAAPATTDLLDAHPEAQAAQPVFRDYGGTEAFCGQAVTVRVFEDNVLVRARLETPGQGRVLVVDGGASLSCALVGGMLGSLGAANGWVGVIVNGCVRDSAELRGLPLGVRALATHPRKSGKGGEGETDVTLTFAGVTVESGDWVYADADGVLVSGERLH